MDKILRKMLLSLGKWRLAKRWAKKYGLRFGASRFVAGETIQQSIAAVRQLNESGRLATLDHLGEYVSNEDEAIQAADMCIQTLDAIASSGMQSHLSLKMTSLGLDLSKELCVSNMQRILDRARLHGIFVRIDMEDYAHCQISIDVFKELRNLYDNVGIVLQAYLFRTLQDAADMHRLGANLRLVKGAYKESPKVAYPAKEDVDENYRKLIQMHLANGHYTAIASHDEAIIHFTKQYVKEYNIPNDRFEFQMLYGICEDLQHTLVSAGYRVRIYVPYGHDWFGYFMRRLAERPANVWFVLKHIFK
ncbi:proline dehydrogenase family protein [Paenibacillus sp. N3.4]|uniref:proline dehydrogenase family protein n=1 Tax=Paenibacillus sp. N3.4 TaxID=2603222 RepID=UPI0011C99F3D|nr:proline dehydrogenase [Paenibacillus sp. N3.4]TXK74678.1 proline dehydrogenase [Paenibacillus sp. N3.4]